MQQSTTFEIKKRTFWQELVSQRYSFLFIAPVLLLFTIFVLIPVLASLFLSFTKYNVVTPPVWIGLKNYGDLIFRDPRFFKAIKNTIFYVCGVVPFCLSISLLLAIAINQKIRFRNLFRTLFFMPTVTAVVAISVIWKWLLAGGKYGLVNYMLLKVGIQPIDWIMDPNFLLPAIIIMSVWAGLGYNMILFLAGLQTIPQTFYEAAEIDGCGAWQKFWNITLPLLRPIMVYVVVMSMINSFQVFDQVFIMTGGQSEGIGGVLDSALTIVPYLYDQGFSRWAMGSASAMAYMLFAIVFIITLINFKIVKSKVDY